MPAKKKSDTNHHSPAGGWPWFHFTPTWEKQMDTYIADTIEKDGYVAKIHLDFDPPNPREWESSLGKMICWHSRYNLGDEHGFADEKELYIELLSGCTMSDEFINSVLLQYIRQNKYGRDEYRDHIEYTREYEVPTKARLRRSFVEDNLAEVMDCAFQDFAELIEESYVILPLYLYDHSGITMNTTGFFCPWDSGGVGYIVASNKAAMKEWGLDSMEDPVVFKGEVVATTLREHVKKILRHEVKTYDDFLTGNVYGYIVESPDGDELDSCWGFYGEEYAREEAMNALEWAVENKK